jgi:hypothetical protein
LQYLPALLTPCRVGKSTDRERRVDKSMAERGFFQRRAVALAEISSSHRQESTLREGRMGQQLPCRMRLLEDSFAIADFAFFAHVADKIQASASAQGHPESAWGCTAGCGRAERSMAALSFVGLFASGGTQATCCSPKS